MTQELGGHRNRPLRWMADALVVHLVDDFAIGRGHEFVQHIPIADAVVVEIDQPDNCEFLFGSRRRKRRINRVAGDDMARSIRNCDAGFRPDGVLRSASPRWPL